jgi:putative flavoprotein involved in K+ transport
MTTLPRRIETAVIGAGQAGLTMSWHLQRAGRDHVVLERRSTPGGGWQDRWDEFRLVGPNWTASFPDSPYDGPDPDAFMPRDEIAGRVAMFGQKIGAPIAFEAGVEQLRARPGGGFELETMQGSLIATEVVVATGGFHVPHVPPIAKDLSPRVLSIHAHHYCRETDLPQGAVLVVGTGQTGVQITEELQLAGREVYLCVGAAGRVPRRYRGRDIFYWLWSLAERGAELGAALPTVAELPDPRGRWGANPALSGHRGGHDTNLRRMALGGTRLLGRLSAIDGERVRIEPNLRDTLAFADRFFDERIRKVVDAFIAADGMDSPPDEPGEIVDYEPPIIEELDLREAGISTILWSSGYRQSLGWIDPQITDDMGFARQDRGVTSVPGLYFLGSLWQHDQTSATLVGMPRDARVLAERMGLAS